MMKEVFEVVSNLRHDEAETQSDYQRIRYNLNKLLAERNAQLIYPLKVFFPIFFFDTYTNKTYKA